ncbi:MAG: hypothetical protein HKO77_01375, partial [Gemmatimonadetes bacterium]|nr:hypothetical protein [Gemmatimonadota bacterium]
MSRIRAVMVVATFVSIGCVDGPLPTEPASDLSPALTVVDASGPQGLEGFHFRGPISDEPVPTDGLDASLLDLLSVEICEWNGTECVLPLVREITADLNAPERIFVSDDGVYATVWSTRKDDLDPERIYRIRVLASGGLLGYVDVDVVEPGRNRRSSGGEDHVHLVAGQSLSIGFVIEEGTGERAGSDGGVVELAGGQITLDLPAGALQGDVLLTATPTDDVPTGGPPIVPGTAWDFGPDGIEFDHPVFMTIPFDPADVPSGVDPNELRIHKVVNGEFVQQNAGLVDLGNNTVSAQVDG